MVDQFVVIPPVSSFACDDTVAAELFIVSDYGAENFPKVSDAASLDSDVDVLVPQGTRPDT